MKRFCDRCGKTIDQFEKFHIVSISSEATNPTIEYAMPKEICRSCGRAFGSWMTPPMDVAAPGGAR